MKYFFVVDTGEAWLVKKPDDLTDAEVVTAIKQIEEDTTPIVSKARQKSCGLTKREILWMFLELLKHNYIVSLVGSPNTLTLPPQQ